MKKKCTALLAFLLCAALLVPLGSCGSDGIGTETPTEAQSDVQTEAPVPAPVLCEGGAMKFALIRPSEAAKPIVTAAAEINNLIAKTLGIRPSFSEDFVTKDKADNDDPEILLGVTNRPVSAEKCAELSAKDWFVGMVGSKLVAVGGSDEATVEALHALRDMIEEALEGKTAADTVTLDALCRAKEYKAEYPARKISVGGTPIGEYVITYSVTAAFGGEAAAKNLQSCIAEACGVLLTVRKSTSKTEYAHEILLGDCLRGESSALTDACKGDIPYALKYADGKLYVCGKDAWGVNAGITKLTAYINGGTDVPADLNESGDAAGTCAFSLTAGADIRILTNNVWKCDSNQAAWKAIGEDCSAASRGPAFAKVYAAFVPDVICLQEMSTVMISSITQELKKAGMQYNKLLAYSDAADETPLLYNAKTVKMLDNGHHLYNYGNNGNSKGYHWALFEHLATGKQFIVLSTHLWWKSESAEPGSDESRRKQAAEIVALSEKLLAQYDVPMFIAGDMNTRVSTTAYAEFTKGKFEDCHDIAAAADNTHGHHQCDNSGYSTELYSGDYSTAIDHILVKNRGDWNVLCFRQPVTDFYWRLTDHIPAYIDVQFS